jgi:RimJ/RimL family protein N-acetyltransferase
VDDEGNVVGHFIIRYPKTDDDSTVRFGFVVIDSNLRGKGYGKEMLLLGIEYVKEHFKVQRIDLGVFENNNNARYCYEAVGVREYSRRLCTMKIGTWECIDMELFL